MRSATGSLNRFKLLAWRSAAVGLLVVALSWFAVIDVKVWRGPNYGILIESRGDLLWEWLYRSDKQSVECSVWRIYDEEMTAAPIVLIRTGRDNHVEFGDGDNW
jgi:hypothetical protein